MSDDEKLKAHGFIKTTYAGFDGWFHRGRDFLYDKKRALEIVAEEEQQSLYSKDTELDK